MNYKLIISLLFCFVPGCLFAQQPEAKYIRIVDTLTTQEKVNRNTVILKSELDSMIQLHISKLPVTLPQEPVIREENRLSEYLLWTAIALLLFITVLLYILFKNQKRFHETVFSLNRKIHQLELAALSANAQEQGPVNKLKGKTSLQGLEKRIHSLSAQLEKATNDNQELERLVNEYTNSKQDFEMVKQQIMDVYKVRNYPGFNKEKSETEIVKSLLETERAVALYAYEHFLKPLLAIADANKNNPAKIVPEEREQMLNLLISLSLLYSEYLYLRINDLSVGGKIVQRIGSLRNGNDIDPSLLKELNIEHGSRALVLRMVLDKTHIQKLTYPVFDETNLNLS